MIKKAPHVAAVHDLSGLGRCSLGIVLPVLSAMGCWCSALPTAYLSASTIFPPSDRFFFRDQTEDIERSIGHWTELDVKLDAIYSGFLGSAEQIDVLERLIGQFRQTGTSGARTKTLVMIDPVMGDWGKRYRTYTEEMCQKMCRLSEQADVITPNLTEAAILLGESYDRVPASPGGLNDWLKRLSLDGRRSVILTGIHPESGSELVGAACLDRESGQISYAAAHEEPAQYPGTGDLFSSVALGCLLKGRSLEEATEQAVSFVQHCARFTIALGTPIPEGVQFESLIQELINL